MDFLNSVAVFVSTNLGASTGIAAVIVEFALRMTKSDKPLSIAHGVAVAVRKIADICKGVADFMDKVLPQKLN